MKKSTAGAALLLAGAVVAAFALGRRPRPVTFAADIAPILHARCAVCHHPGGSAPFALLGYEDAKGRAGQISDLVQRRIMPPWLPEPGCADFVGDRSLSGEEIERIRRWEKAGAPEGDPSALPAPPTWNDGWQLGKPDLVVTLPQPYAIAADGQDVYRNFVVPIPLSGRRFVKDVEFQPGNLRVVHHAFLFVDPTRESLRQDLKDPEPGFPGLHVPSTAQAPAGHFLSWQPGKRYVPDREDLAWPLEKNSFLVLQLHLRPSGKAERLQPSVAFYFTDKAPTRLPVKLGLWSNDIDLPAGARATTVKDSLTLPIDLEILRILPHAHYLGRRLEALARLPDGTTRCLLRINAWDFNWQGDYAYRNPVFLPKGSVVTMEYTYDNSADNPRNPNQPPRRVTYGLQSSDEMAELWMQALPRRDEDAKLLDRENQQKVFDSALAYNRSLLGTDPGNARAHLELGKVLLFQRKAEEARSHLEASIRIRRDDDESHYFLGLLHRTQDRNAEARAEFEEVIRINPEHAKGHGNLGLVLMELKLWDDAVRELETALRLNPADELARSSLEEIAAARRAAREKQ
jgi:tetratricopeptide (TPR) repeat protein